MIKPVSHLNLDTLRTRARITNEVRNFFIDQGFLEIDTPIRCPSIIPEAHIDPVKSEGCYLQASPELCMKRLLASGCEKIFQICKCFRKNERGVLHLPELTLLEWYAEDSSYLDLMTDCERLFQHIASRMGLKNTLVYQGREIDLFSPWERLTVEAAFARYGSISMDDALKKNTFDEIVSFEIEPHLGHPSPVFLVDYPASMASLAKLKSDNDLLAERFELYVSGIELANAFTELTDPVDQRKRFEAENRRREANHKALLPMPEKFLADLKNMGSCAGIALGVDRLVMLFCDAASIDEVVAFTPEML